MGRAWFKAILVTFLLGGSYHAYSDVPISPLTYQCILEVSQRYGIHTDVLLAILIVEGGTVGQNNRGNSNGSYDIGPFQINSIHLPELRRRGVSEAQLRNNGCVNAHVAAWHLQRVVMVPEVLRTIHDEESYLRALARYHSATPVHNQRYAELLRKAFKRLYNQGGRS